MQLRCICQYYGAKDSFVGFTHLSAITFLFSWRKLPLSSVAGGQCRRPYHDRTQEQTKLMYVRQMLHRQAF